MIYKTKYSRWKIVRDRVGWSVVFKPHGIRWWFRKWVLFRYSLHGLSYADACVELQKELDYERN